MVLNLQYLEAFSILPAIWPLAYPPKTSERSQSGDLQSWLYSVKKRLVCQKNGACRSRFVKGGLWKSDFVQKWVYARAGWCKSGFRQTNAWCKKAFVLKLVGVKERLWKNWLV